MKKLYAVVIAFIDMLLLAENKMNYTIGLISFISFYLCLKDISIIKRIMARLRGKIYNIITMTWNSKVRIYENIDFKNIKQIYIGSNSTIEHDTQLYALKDKGKIIIGNNVHIGPFNRFSSCDEIIIEDNVLFAAYVHITDHSHEYRDIKIPVLYQGIFSDGSVRIGEGSWIGIKAEILSGVTIGKHCIIAAGAVVTKNIPDYCVVAGIPAKIIKKYNFETQHWEKIKN